MIVAVQVEHWWGRLPLEFVDGVDGPSDGVTRVYVRRGDEKMVLAGWDTYWLAGDRFGYSADPENFYRYAVRPRPSAWCWPEGHNPRRDDRPMPDGATVWRGVMLPDDQARQVGLL